MTFGSWFDDAGNLLDFGRSQTGKTTAVREVHAENKRVSIWLNETGDDRVPLVSGKRVRGTRAIETGLANDVYKFNYIAQDRVQAIQELQEWAWRKAEKADRKFPMQIIVDELHRLAPNSRKDELPGRDEVRRLCKEGMKRNVKFIGITQDPVSMDPQTRRQRDYLLLFPLVKEQKDVITDYVDHYKYVPRQPEYAGVVYHAEGHVVAEGVKAAGKYAE